MEWSTINTLSVTNQLTTKFAAEWSKDGRFFVITDNNVMILKLAPTVTHSDNTLSFQRTEIQMSNYHVAKSTNIDIENHLLSAEKEVLFHSLLNSNVTPDITMSTKMIPRPVFAAWSPIPLNGNFSFNAMLAVVSNSGNVEIYVQGQIKCHLLVNITGRWVKHLQKNIWNTNKEYISSSDKCKVHLERVADSIAICAAWSKVYKENNSHYFLIAVAFQSGYLTIWKLPYFNTFPNTPVQPNLVGVCQTYHRITALHMCSTKTHDWIIFGDLDGKVMGLSIDNLNPNTFADNDMKYDDFLDIWIYKDIQVSKILDFTISNYTCLLVIKGPYILVTILDDKDKVNQVQVINFKNLNITGIVQHESNSFIISTMTGVISLLQVFVKNSEEGEEIQYILTPVHTDIKWEYHACYGIIRSPNKIFYGIVTLPCKLTDHLVLRNPIEIAFTIHNEFDPSLYLKLNPKLRENETWECLQLIRCLSTKNNSLPSKYIEIPEQFDFLSVDELRVLMWICLFTQNFVQTRPKFKIQINNLPKEEDLKSIIYFKYRVDRLHNLVKAYNLNRNLSDYQQYSLHMLHDAVIDFTKDEIFKKYFTIKTLTNMKCIFAEVLKMPMKVPKCLWCEESLTSKPCKTDHPDQRCCISGMQFSGIAKWECGNCGLPADDKNDEEDLFCPMCDVSMTNLEL